MIDLDNDAGMLMFWFWFRYWCFDSGVGIYVDTNIGWHVASSTDIDGDCGSDKG